MNKATHNFAQVNQATWIIPASLGKKLMKSWADELVSSSKEEIVGELISNLQNAKTVAEATQVALDFANERQLIAHIVKNEWDVYKVPELANKIAIVETAERALAYLEHGDVNTDTLKEGLQEIVKTFR